MIRLQALESLSKKDWIEYLEEYFSSIPKSSYLSFFIVFAFLILTYSYYAIAVTLDQEGLGSITERGEYMINAYRGAARPILWFLSSRVLSGSFMPVLNMTIACALLTWASLLYSGIFANRTIVARVIPALVMATFPLFSAALPLHLWNVAFGLSYLTACAALYLVVVHERWVFAGILLTVTFANYQPSVGFFFAGVVARVIYSLSTERDFVGIRRLIVNGVLAGVLGASLYAPIFLYLSMGASGYAAQQTTIIANPGALFANILEVLWPNFKRASGAGFYHTNIQLVFVALFFIYVLTAFYQAWKTYRGYAVVSLSVVFLGWCLMLLAATPIELFLEGKFLWNRASTALAIPISLVCAVLLQKQSSTVARNLTTLLSVYLIFTFVQYHHASAFSQHMTNKHNFSVGIRIADRIEQLADYDKSKKYTIVAANLGWYSVHAAGSRNYTSDNVTNVYAWQFRWFIGNHFKIIGLNNVGHNPAPNKVLKFEKELLNTMPAWPTAGSIAITSDDVIIIKF